MHIPAREAMESLANCSQLPASRAGGRDGLLQSDDAEHLVEAGVAA